MSDQINPTHYKSGSIQAINLTRYFSFAVGNLIKYVWRAGNKPIKGDYVAGLNQDLDKALWYLKEASSNPSLNVANRHEEVDKIVESFKYNTVTDRVERDILINNIVKCFYREYSSSNISNLEKSIEVFRNYVIKSLGNKEEDL